MAHHLRRLNLRATTWCCIRGAWPKPAGADRPLRAGGGPVAARWLAGGRRHAAGPGLGAGRRAARPWLRRWRPPPTVRCAGHCRGPNRPRRRWSRWARCTANWACAWADPCAGRSRRCRRRPLGHAGQGAGRRTTRLADQVVLEVLHLPQPGGRARGCCLGDETSTQALQEAHRLLPNWATPGRPTWRCCRWRCASCGNWSEAKGAGVVELVLASAVLAVCVALLLRLVLPGRSAATSTAASGQLNWRRLRWTARQAWSRRNRRDAERVADRPSAAPHTASGQSHMVSPDAAKGPRKPLTQPAPGLRAARCRGRRSAGSSAPAARPRRCRSARWRQQCRRPATTRQPARTTRPSAGSTMSAISRHRPKRAPPGAWRVVGAQRHDQPGLMPLPNR